LAALAGFANRKVTMSRASAIGLAVGIVYALAYLALAVGAAGAGHGTYVFFAPISPYCSGLLFFPVAGYLTGDLRSSLSKALFLSALTVHYALTIIFLRVEWIRDFSYLEKVWKISPWGILLPAGWYLLGQVIIWAVLIRGVVLQARRAS
jgi:hypothetical protein